ncbi:MAG: carbohydrate ABC transporter permease, partial [Armatimonadota bacterium]|nr:carbohydrate ABC transporter permease [Armatimonadota bacterium]
MSRLLRRALLYAAALAFTVFAVFPFYWMLITAFKQNRDLYVGATNLQHIPWVFNETPTLQHVRLLFLNTPYLLWLRNTAFVGALVVLITLLVAVP